MQAGRFSLGGEDLQGGAKGGPDSEQSPTVIPPSFGAAIVVPHNRCGDVHRQPVLVPKAQVGLKLGSDGLGKGKDPRLVEFAGLDEKGLLACVDIPQGEARKLSAADPGGIQKKKGYPEGLGS
jgi:hypothetical protein